jgi:copper oxidase (laccase) domain-containing protein
MQLIRYPIFQNESKICAFIMVRRSRVSRNLDRDFNLSYSAGDQPAHVSNNRQLLLKNLSRTTLVELKQIHSANIIWLDLTAANQS